MPAELRGARRILAVRLDNIGDVVLTGPALRALGEALPEARITLLASRAGAEMAPLLPWVSDVVVQRPVWQDVSGAVPFDPDREVAFAASLRERAFDAAFVFTSFNQSADVPAYVAYLAGIPIRVGYAPLFSGGVFSLPVPPPERGAHAVDRNAGLVEAAGIRVDDRSLELRLPADAARAARRLLAESSIDPDRPYVVAAPGASCDARRYPPERFGAVVAELAADGGLPVVLVGHERELPVATRVLEAASAARPGRSLDIVPAVGRTDLATLTGLVAGAALVVANNSGPIHLADAFRRPQVVLYSGTDLESQWRPRSSPSVLLRRETDCSPCYRRDCPYALACLDFSPRDVVDAALRLLAGSPSRPIDPLNPSTLSDGSLRAPIQA